MREGALLLRRRLPVLVHGVARGRGGGGRGRVEVEWLPFELRPAPRPLLEPRGDHLRVDWTQQRLPARARARGRDPPAALPAALDAAARGLPLGRRAGPARGRSSTRSTRRSSARARTSRRTPRSRARPSVPGSTRTARSRAAYSPERIARIREIGREAEAAGVRGVPSLLHRGRARRTGAWAASSGCSPASRSSRAPPEACDSIRARGCRSARRRARGRPCASARCRAEREPRRGSGRASPRPARSPRGARRPSVELERRRDDARRPRRPRLVHQPRQLLRLLARHRGLERDACVRHAWIIAHRGGLHKRELDRKPAPGSCRGRAPTGPPVALQRRGPAKPGPYDSDP